MKKGFERGAARELYNESGSLRSDIRRRGNVAVLKPLHTDVLVCLIVRELVQIGHEDLQTGLRSHAGIAVHKLFLIMSKIEIEPRVIRKINHDEIDMMHRELSEVQGSVPKLQKIAPLLVFFSLLGIPVTFLEIRVDDTHAR